MFEQVQFIRSFLRMAWLYRWAGMVLAAVLCFFGWGFVQSMPDTYEVRAKVFLDSRSMLRPLLSGIAFNSGALSDTAILLSKTLLTRPNLEEIARRADLDLKAKTPEEFDTVINNLASKISIATGRGDNIYDISFTDGDPKVAKLVVDELLNTFMEQSLGDSRKDSVTTQNFLEQQIAAYEKRLIESEDRLKQFKQRNVGIMPGSQGGFFSQLESAMKELKDAQLKLKEAQRRRDQMKKEIETISKASKGVEGYVDEDDLWAALDEEPGVGAAEFPELAVFDNKISDLESRIEELLLNYTEKHPDIVAMRKLIQKYEQRKEDKAKELMAAAANAPAGTDDFGPSGLESPYQQQIKLKAAQADATVAGLQERVKEFKRRVKDLRKRVDIVPEVEAELTRLNRDYGITKSQYDELLKRRELMNMGREADQSEDEVKIKIIEPTRVPLEPTGPHRILFASIVLLAGLGIGAAFAVVLSQLNPRIVDIPDLKTLTGLPVLGVISMMSSVAHRQQRRMEMTAFVLVLSGLIGIYAGQIALDLLGFDVHNKIATLMGKIS